MKLRQFFTEANDRLSMMRLISLILILGGLGLCYLYPDKSVGEIVIALGLSGKAGQKIFGEKKNISDKTESI